MSPYDKYEAQARKNLPHEISYLNNWHNLDCTNWTGEEKIG